MLSNCVYKLQPKYQGVICSVAADSVSVQGWQNAYDSQITLGLQSPCRML